MSLFARRNEEFATDSPLTVKDVTLGAVSRQPPVNEIHIEAEDDERNGRIGKGSRLSGTLVFEGSVRVYGEVEGEIVAGEAVIVRRGGKVNAKIRATELVIEGHVTADVQVTGRVEIGVTGSFSGSLVTMYARTPALRKPGSIWPSQAGIAVSKDIWMLGIGLGLVADAFTAGSHG